MRLSRLPDTVVRRLLVSGLLLVALALVGLFVGVALARMAYPFELEWMEGGGLDTVHRMLVGQGVYVAPSAEFIPYRYTPLYYAVCALLTRAVGEGFLPLRLVSFLASLATMALLFATVRALKGGVLPAFLSAALFAAAFHVSGDYADVARADSLCVMLLVGGFAIVARGGMRPQSAIASGLVFGLAYLAKQSALPALAPFLLYALMARPRFGWTQIGVLVLVVGGSTLWLSSLTGGWYAFYTLQLAARNTIHLSNLPAFWAKYVGPLGIALTVGLAWFLDRPEGHEDTRPAVGLFAAGLSLSSWWISLSPGEAPNIAMPAVASICLLFGLGLDGVLRRLRGSAGGFVRGLEWLVYGACSLQFVSLTYNPERMIPTRADREAGWTLVRFLARQPGEVLVPFHSYLARMAGKPGHFQSMALADVVGRGEGAAGRSVQQEIDRSMRQGRYSAVVLDRTIRDVLAPYPRYREARAFFADDDVFRTRVGSITRPEFVHVLLPDSSANRTRGGSVGAAPAPTPP